MGYAEARLLITSQLSKYHEEVRPVMHQKGVAHQRSEPHEYDPTPICTGCMKAWDETGGYRPDYSCPFSPGHLMNELIVGWQRAREQPDEEHE